MNDAQLSRIATGLSLVGLFLAGPVLGHEVFVSPAGDDGHSGTSANPVATLEKARDLLRDSERLGVEPCTVWIAGGRYALEDTFRLSARDSGTADAPVVYRAVEGASVALIGGRALHAADFVPVVDPVTVARLQPHARGKVVELDLAEQRIQHGARYPDVFTDNGGIVELFVNNRRMPLSRYPNTFGEMTLKRVEVNGGGQEIAGDWRVYYNTGTPEQKAAMRKGPPRPGVFEYDPVHQAAHERWAKVLDRGVWAKGYWRVVWQNETVRIGAIDSEAQTVTLAQPVGNGIGSKYHRPEGSGAEIYWVMNLLEEVDQPGEWAIDFRDGKLYFYPPIALDEADVLISDLAAPVIALEDVSHVTLRNLLVEGSLGDGIRIHAGQSNAVVGCTVRNVTQYGVRIEGGTDHVVRSCDLYALGAGGVWLSGGNAGVSPRVPARHQVVNNDIHHFGEVERVYAPGVNVGFVGGGGGSSKVDAVGMRVAHNAIHHGPHAGVLFNSFDNLFEFNEVFQFALVSNDMGAFYSYAKEGGIGHNTFRHNFMHSSPEGDGIYYDNLADRPTIVGNIAFRLGPPGSPQQARRGCGFLVKNFGKAPVDIRNNLAVACNQGYAITRGTEFSISNNVSVACGHPSPSVPGLVVYAADPGFVDLDALDLSLKATADVYQQLPGFDPIPFQRIGLFADPYRLTVPDYRRQMAGWQPEGQAAGYSIQDRD